jgi:hypothetical protein
MRGVKLVSYAPRWPHLNGGSQPDWVEPHADGGNGFPTHVFATVGGHVVDSYTRGRRERFTGVSDEYLPFRVKRTFLVNP